MNEYFDSIDKIRHYLLMVGLEYNSPKRFSISKTFWRDYACLEGCGACCRAFTMDFWEDEFMEFVKIYPEKKEIFKRREIEIFGEKDAVYSNYDDAKKRLGENDKERCQFLNLSNGFCGIHQKNAFSCQFELNRLQYFPKQDRCILNKKKFRNSWRWEKIDGGKGVFCDEMINVSLSVVKKVVGRDLPYFERLKWLLERYNRKTERIERIIETLNQQAFLLLNNQEIDSIVEIASGKTLF